MIFCFCSCFYFTNKHIHLYCDIMSFCTPLVNKQTRITTNNKHTPQPTSKTRLSSPLQLYFPADFRTAKGWMNKNDLIRLYKLDWWSKKCRASNKSLHQSAIRTCVYSNYGFWSLVRHCGYCAVTLSLHLKAQKQKIACTCQYALVVAIWWKTFEYIADRIFALSANFCSLDSEWPSERLLCLSVLSTHFALSLYIHTHWRLNLGFIGTVLGLKAEHRKVLSLDCACWKLFWTVSGQFILARVKNQLRGNQDEQHEQCSIWRRQNGWVWIKKLILIF